jgi:hypothetical protein
MDSSSEKESPPPGPEPPGSTGGTGDPNPDSGSEERSPPGSPIISKPPFSIHQLFHIHTLNQIVIWKTILLTRADQILLPTDQPTRLLSDLVI